MEAHGAYLLGRHYFEKRTFESLTLALESFRRAIEFDPDYAPAWVGIGNTYRFLSERAYGKVPHEQAVKRARGALDRALELDPDLAEAHAALGSWYANRGDVLNAIPHFERAIKSNPNAAEAWHWYAGALEVSARLTEAFDAMQRAAALDPLSIVINYNLAQALIDRGRLDEAGAVAGKMLLIEPNSFLGPLSIGHIHRASGRIPEAIMAYRQALALKGFAVFFDLGETLADIGLVEAAYEILKGTPFEGVGDLYRGDLDLALVFARANWPSSPSDGVVHGFRGYVELLAGDLVTAISYFEKTQELLGPAMTVDFLIGPGQDHFGDRSEGNRVIFPGDPEVVEGADPGLQILREPHHHFHLPVVPRVPSQVAAPERERDDFPHPLRRDPEGAGPVRIDHDPGLFLAAQGGAEHLLGFVDLS